MLRSILTNVEQNPKWHPEGNVWNHSVLVRRALPSALGIWEGYAECISLSLLPTPSEQDIHILKVAAWLHDLGKASSSGTKAVGHDRREIYEPFWERLRMNPHWEELLVPIQTEVRFIVENHMFSTVMGKGMQNKWVTDKGFYKPDRNILRTLIFKMMDLIGRGEGVEYPDARAFMRSVLRAAEDKKARVNKQQAPAMTGDQVVESMQGKGCSFSAIKGALDGMLRKGTLSEEEHTTLLGSL